MVARTAPHTRASAPAPKGFYADVLRIVRAQRIPFLIGGTCAVNSYLGTSRELKDLDLFCLAGDYPRILRACAAAGYRTAVEDERWIAKVFHAGHYCDVIFGSANMITPVTPAWFREAWTTRAFGVPSRLLPPTELVWSKCFVADKQRFDGNEVAHLLLVMHDRIDWRRLTAYMEQQWEVLLDVIIRFRFIYPTERHRIPDPVLDELLARLANQRAMPPPRLRACRGRLFSRDDFEVDITRWGFADVVGDEHHHGTTNTLRPVAATAAATTPGRAARQGRPPQPPPRRGRRRPARPRGGRGGAR